MRHKNSLVNLNLNRKRTHHSVLEVYYLSIRSRLLRTRKDHNRLSYVYVWCWLFAISQIYYVSYLNLTNVSNLKRSFLVKYTLFLVVDVAIIIIVLIKSCLKPDFLDNKLSGKISTSHKSFEKLVVAAIWCMRQVSQQCGLELRAGRCLISRT